MISPISNQIPRGDSLAQAVSEHQKYVTSEDAGTKIQRGLDAANNRNAPRKSHAEFMAELGAQIMARINAG